MWRPCLEVIVVPRPRLFSRSGVAFITLVMMMRMFTVMAWAWAVGKATNKSVLTSFMASPLEKIDVKKGKWIFDTTSLHQKATPCNSAPTIFNATLFTTRKIALKIVPALMFNSCANRRHVLYRLKAHRRFRLRFLLEFEIGFVISDQMDFSWREKKKEKS